MRLGHHQEVDTKAAPLQAARDRQVGQRGAAGQDDERGAAADAARQPGEQRRQRRRALHAQPRQRIADPADLRPIGAGRQKYVALGGAREPSCGEADARLVADHRPRDAQGRDAHVLEQRLVEDELPVRAFERLDVKDEHRLARQRGLEALGLEDSRAARRAPMDRAHRVARLEGPRPREERRVGEKRTSRANLGEWRAGRAARQQRAPSTVGRSPARAQFRARAMVRGCRTPRPRATAPGRCHARRASSAQL